MRLALTLFLATGVALALAACETGDKQREPSPTRANPTATRTVAPTPTLVSTGVRGIGSIIEIGPATAEPTATVPTPSLRPTDPQDRFAGIFAIVNDESLAPYGGDAELGDPSLKAYLLGDSEFPSGHTGIELREARLPQHLSEYGRINLASRSAVYGDPKKDAGPAFLMSSVIRFDGLDDLETVLATAGRLSAENLRQIIADEEIDGGSTEGIGVKLLDRQGLGDAAVAFELQIDLNAFLGDEGDTGLATVTQRIYLFARGNVLGVLEHSGLENGRVDGRLDERELAEQMFEKLQ